MKRYIVILNTALENRIIENIIPAASEEELLELLKDELKSCCEDGEEKDLFEQDSIEEILSIANLNEHWIEVFRMEE